MKTKVQKWGNSLAVRIPRALASEASLEQDTPVDLTVQDGQIVVQRIRRRKYTLEELVADMTDENRQEEVDFGPPVGNEVWW